MKLQRLIFPAAIFTALVIGLSIGHAEEKFISESQRLQIALEALNRIESDPSTNAVLKEAVYGVLEKVRGTPEFVRIVQKFNLKDQNPGLLEIVQSHSASETVVEAIRLVLAANDLPLLQQFLGDAQPKQSARLLEALGNAKDKQTVPILAPVVTDLNREVMIRKTAVRALAQTPEGSTELLNLVRAEKLPADLRLTASEELNAIRWQKIKAEAERLLPLPKARNAQPLPPISHLAKMEGDPVKGETIYFSEAIACASCHQVRGRGVEIGPNLSEIGAKLAREALLEAILEPSAGISFGYEAHQIELKSGDEAFGLLASETADGIAIKDLKGIVTQYKKTDVVSRTRLKNSIMPVGLTESLSPQELVDLIEYLASLKKL